MTRNSNLESRIGAAYEAHAGGQTQAAERSYRALLAEFPAQVDVLYLLSTLLGEQPESLDLARRAIEASHGQGGIGVGEASLRDHYARLLGAFGQPPETEAVQLREADRLEPGNAERLFRLADAERRADRPADAAATLLRYLALRPADVNAGSNLGALQFQLGQFAESAATLLAVVERSPGHPQALNNLGNAYAELGNLELACERYRQAVEARPEFTEAWLNLGGKLDTLGRHDEAIAAYERALELAPQDPRALRGRNAVHVKLVPRWHFPMMNDRRRNEAYESALRAEIARRREAGANPLVLDIGSGSGLLSLMAARAGAERVVTCEMVAPVAEMAEAIIARNGYADRIALHRMKSTLLEVGTELPRRADLLVTEIFDVGLLGEFALPTLAHARRALLAEDARIIPGGAQVMMVPVESPEIYENFRVQNRNGCGFDLEAFNLFAKADYEQLALRRYAHVRLAPAQPVFDFDFQRDVPDRETRLEFVAAQNGTVHAWVFWFRLALDGATSFDTGPDQPDTCWAQAVQVLPAPLEVRAGQVFRVQARHTQTNIRFESVA